MHGAVEREDGGREFYRAPFIRLNLDAFNCRPAKS
jgi:hypothetical protein